MWLWVWSDSTLMHTVHTVRCSQGWWTCRCGDDSLAFGALCCVCPNAHHTSCKYLLLRSAAALRTALYQYLLSWSLSFSLSIYIRTSFSFVFMCYWLPTALQCRIQRSSECYNRNRAVALWRQRPCPLFCWGLDHRRGLLLYSYTQITHLFYIYFVMIYSF